jgi:hypothetical protein
LRGKDVGQGLDGVRILTEGLVVGSSERQKWVALRGKRWRMQGLGVWRDMTCESHSIRRTNGGDCLRSGVRQEAG